jgi:hypothetical protein
VRILEVSCHDNSRDELAARIDEFVLAYDEHDAKPYRWTHDGSPLKAA